MNFQDVFKKSFLEGFTGSDISTSKVAATMLVTCILALYIFAMYLKMTKTKQKRAAQHAGVII